MTQQPIQDTDTYGVHVDRTNEHFADVTQHVVTFDTIQALKDSPLTFEDGDVVLLLGYYAAQDGGGGLFRWNASDSTSADNGGTIIQKTAGGSGRWFRHDVKQLWAEYFGVTSSAPSTTARTTNMNVALEAGRTLGYEELHVGSKAYSFNGQLVADDMCIVGQGMGRTILECTTSLGAGVPFITQTLINAPRWGSGLRHVWVRGPGPRQLGVKTANCDGVKCLLPMRYDHVRVSNFDCGFVCASELGHVTWNVPMVSDNYYGIYFSRGYNGDWRIQNGDVNGNTFANIGIPGNMAIVGLVMEQVHCGFAPYAFYQEDDPSDAGWGFLYWVHARYCAFEVFGNGLAFTEQYDSTHPDAGGVVALELDRCSCTWAADYRIAARPKDYAIMCNTGQHYNTIETEIANGDLGGIYVHAGGGNWKWDMRHGTASLVWGAGVSAASKLAWHCIPQNGALGQAQIAASATSVAINTSYSGPAETVKVRLTMRSLGGLTNPQLYVSNITSNFGTNTTTITVSVLGGIPSSNLLFDYSLA